MQWLNQLNGEMLTPNAKRYARERDDGNETSHAFVHTTTSYKKTGAS